MIFGIGTDVAEVPRFEKWVRDDALISRFFGEAERFAGDGEAHLSAASQHYAARFAAKEAFSKALGTGFVGLSLKDFWVVKDESGKPSFAFGDATQKCLCARAGTNCRVHLSMSHEKAYATAVVVIETEEDGDVRKCL